MISWNLLCPIYLPSHGILKNYIYQMTLFKEDLIISVDNHCCEYFCNLFLRFESAMNLNMEVIYWDLKHPLKNRATPFKKNHKVKPWVKLTKIFHISNSQNHSSSIKKFQIFQSPESIFSKDFHMKYLLLKRFLIATSFTLWLFYLKRLLTQKEPKLNEFVYNFHMTVPPVNSATGQLSCQLLRNFSS